MVETIREMRVTGVSCRKAAASRHHAVSVFVYDGETGLQRPVTLKVFPTAYSPSPLGWERWTDERRRLVLATRPKRVAVKIVPSRHNPAAPWFLMARESHDAWIERIRAASGSSSAAPAVERVAMQDGAVAVLQPFDWRTRVVQRHLFAR